MDIEAKRPATPSDAKRGKRWKPTDVAEMLLNLEQLMETYRDAYANMGIATVEELKARMAERPSSLTVPLSQVAVTDFAYLKAFVALKHLVLEGEVEGSEVKRKHYEQAELERDRIRLGIGLDKTTISSLAIRAADRWVSLTPEMAPTVHLLTKIDLECCVDHPDPLVPFDFHALKELRLGYKPVYYAWIMASTLQLETWCAPVPSLKTLVLTNVADAHNVNLGVKFPNVESVQVRYCKTFQGFTNISNRDISSNLKHFTFHHCPDHVRNRIHWNAYPVMETLVIDNDAPVPGNNTWDLEVHGRPRDLTVPFHATLKDLTIRHVPNLFQLNVFPEARQPSALRSIDVQYSTNRIEFSRYPRIIFPHLSSVSVKEGFFPFDILELPALKKYQGSFAISPFMIQREQTSVPFLTMHPDLVVDTPFIRSLVARIAEANPRVIMVIPALGVYNAPPEDVALYEQYKPQYEALGHNSLADVYRWRPEQDFPYTLTMPLLPVLLQDFSYLALFSKMRQLTRLLISNGLPRTAQEARERQSFVECTLGPHLRRSMPAIEQVQILSMEHVLVDIDDACLAVPVESRNIELDLTLKVMLRRPISLPSVAKFSMGNHYSVAHSFSDVRPITVRYALHVEWTNVVGEGDVVLNAAYPSVSEMHIHLCRMTTIPEQWRSTTLKTLVLQNVAFSSLPATDWAARFPNLQRLSIKRVSTSEAGAPRPSLGNEVIDDRYVHLTSLDIVHVPMASLTFRSSRPLRLMHLSYWMNQRVLDPVPEPWMEDPALARASLYFDTPTMLRRLTSVFWHPPMGNFPLSLFQVIDGNATIDNPTPVSYTGSFRVLAPPGGLNIDPYTTYTGNGPMLSNIERENRPGIRIRSTALDRWRASMQRTSQAARLGRPAPYIVKFEHDLICGRTDLWKHAAETMEAFRERVVEGPSLLAAVKIGVQQVEMAANAAQKTRMEQRAFERMKAIQRGEDVPMEPERQEVDEMVAAKASLKEAMTMFNRVMADERIYVFYEDDFFHFRYIHRDIPPALQPAVDRMLTDPDEDDAIAAFNKSNVGVTAWVEKDKSIAVGQEWMYQVISPFHNTTCTTCSLPFYRDVHQADDFPTQNEDLLATDLSPLEDDTTGQLSGGIAVCNFTEYDYRKQKNLPVRGTPIPPLTAPQEAEFDQKHCGHVKHFFHHLCYIDLLVKNRPRKCIHTREVLFD